MTDNGIRSYGPGKFRTILDSYVYSVSLDGSYDDDISVGDGGWYGMMRNGRTILRDHDPELETLNAAEQEALTSCAGVIMFERSDGIVEVEYYDTVAQLDAAWKRITREFAETETEE
jgi:hypothetical protein